MTLDHLKQVSSSFPFTTTIQSLRQDADARRDITWNIQGDTLYRHVNKLSTDMFAPEDYMVYILNLCRSAKILCELYDNKTDAFDRLAQVYMKEYANHLKTCTSKHETTIYKIAKDSHKDILDVLERHLPYIKHLNKHLKLASNYAGLDDQHLNIVTDFKINNNLFTLKDEKSAPLTPEQRDHFIHRKKEAWYLDLSDLEQRLIERYVDKILDNQHYIPTQLRNLPGCRNAYKKSLLVEDPKMGSKTLAQYIHSGTLWSSNPVSRHKFAEESLKQLQQGNAASSDLIIMILNHDAKLKGHFTKTERQIVKTMQSVVNPEYYMCWPINKMGTSASPAFREPTQKMLSAISQCFEATKDTLCHSNQGRDKPSKFNRYFFQCVNELKAALGRTDAQLQAQQQFGQRMGANHTSITSNFYADLASNIVFCKSYLNQQHCTKYPPIAVNCKSGKDRTGYISLLSDSKIIQNYLQNQNDNISLKQVASDIASTGHIQLLAGLNGGTPGKFGIMTHVIKNNKIEQTLDAMLKRPSARLP